MGRQLLVLTVPDEPQRKALHKRLKRLGFFVLSTTEPNQGLSLIVNNVPRLFVLEPRPEAMDATEFGRRARDLLGERVPMIYFTASFSIDDFEQWLSVGVDDFLLKAGPLNPLTERVRFWTRSSRRRLPGAVRHQMLMSMDGARTVANLAAQGRLSSETDDNVAEISAFVGSARDYASDYFGRTVIEKLGLLGYVVGAVEHCSRTNLKVKVCFGDYLRIVLLETGILTRAEIEQMLDNWDDLINSGPFRSASESAGPEFAQWLSEGERFRPRFLASLERRFREVGEAAAG